MPARKQQKKLGRPFDEQLDAALLDATRRILANEGFSGLNVDRIASEVGTTRATFYRRYKNVGYIAFSVVAERFGVRETPNTGSLPGDILRLARDQVAMFADPLVRKSIPGLLETIRLHDDLRALYLQELVLARRRTVSECIERGVSRGEIARPTHDTIEWVCDLILGPVLAHSVLPLGRPVDDRLARSITSTVMRELTHRPLYQPR